jgi:hypothetical protein
MGVAWIILATLKLFPFQSQINNTLMDKKQLQWHYTPSAYGISVNNNGVQHPSLANNLTTEYIVDLHNYYHKFITQFY